MLENKAYGDNCVVFRKEPHRKERDYPGSFTHVLFVSAQAQLNWAEYFFSGDIRSIEKCNKNTVKLNVEQSICKV